MTVIQDWEFVPPLPSFFKLFFSSAVPPSSSPLLPPPPPAWPCRVFLGRNQCKCRLNLLILSFSSPSLKDYLTSDSFILIPASLSYLSLPLPPPYSPFLRPSANLLYCKLHIYAESQITGCNKLILSTADVSRLSSAFSGLLAEFYLRDLFDSTLPGGKSSHRDTFLTEATEFWGRNN